MKNIIIYYFTILIPIPLLIWSAFNNSILFLVLIIGYAIFRGFVDGRRLTDKKLLDKNQSWKAFIPFWTSKYFKELYFEV